MRKAINFFGLLFTISLVAFAFTNPVEVETYTVDTEASTMEWFASKVTGKHNGTVNVKSGSLDFTDGALTGGSFEIDMTTIAVTDLTGNMAEKLKGHLMSEDFFGVEKFPTAKFVISSVAPRGTDGDYTVKGDLTIKESTNPIRFIAKVTTDNGKVMAAAEEIMIDRSEYNVKYGSGSFFGNLGDKTIYDEFTLKVNLVAAK